MKYTLGQKVWTIIVNKPQEQEITAIGYSDLANKKVGYCLKDYSDSGIRIWNFIPESQVFETKQDLINSL